MIHIKKATLADIPQLARLFDAYRVFYHKNSDIEGAESFLRERLEAGESEIFVAEQKEVLLGFVQLYPIFSSTQMKRLWLLNDLFVSPEHRKKRISIALIERAKELCQETAACGLLLETAKSNHVGNQLYPKTGFVVDNDHHYYYWEKVD
ncbi:MAG: GNAT family N-acetyltransferase [Bacteroidia bacterium]